MTAHALTVAILASIDLCLLVVAAVFGVLGWLSNAPNSSRRYQRRMVAFVLVFVFWAWGYGAVDRHHAWYAWVFFAIGCVFLLDGAERNYKRREQWRKAETALQITYTRPMRRR